MSWNCNGIKSSHVNFLQEHWLRQDELNFLNDIHSDFIGQGVSAINSSDGLLQGRPYGGVAILWRKSIAKHITVQNYDDPRIIGCEIGKGDNIILFVNVYSPYQKCENRDDYVHHLGELSSIIENSNTAHISIVGDFNANVGTYFEEELLEFTDKHKLVISDYEMYGRSSIMYTYVSDAHGTTSWLDHYLCSGSLNNNIINIHVMDLPPSSYHRPLVATTFKVNLVMGDTGADIPLIGLDPRLKNDLNIETIPNISPVTYICLLILSLVHLVTVSAQIIVMIWTSCTMPYATPCTRPVLTVYRH